MKRSCAVQLTLVTSVASLLIQCDRRPTRYCVDENQTVSDDNKCEDNYRTGGAYARSFSHRYHWYYGGAHGAVPTGTHLGGGSTTPPREGFVRPTAGSVSESSRGVIGHAGEAAAAGHGSGVGE